MNRIHGRQSVESYAHKAAKQVVVGWLRDVAGATVNGPVDYTPRDALDISWRPNRGEPHFGVWEEYPILENGVGISPVWDEVSLDGVERHENGSYSINSPYRGLPPTYAELTERKEPLRAILDIAVQHKGAICLGIEIVHKNPPHQAKLDFLRRGVHLQTLLILPASWVLAQVEMPKECPDKFWAWGGQYR